MAIDTLSADDNERVSRTNLDKASGIILEYATRTGCTFGELAQRFMAIPENAPEIAEVGRDVFHDCLTYLEAMRDVDKALQADNLVVAQRRADDASRYAYAYNLMLQHFQGGTRKRISAQLWLKIHTTFVLQ